MSKKLRWVPQTRKYRQELGQEEKQNPHVKVKEHPLQVETKAEDVNDELEKSLKDAWKDLEDPLGATDVVDEDPLMSPGNTMAIKQTAFTSGIGQPKGDARTMQKKSDDLLDWDHVKKQILTQYTTQKDIPIVSKIVDDVEKEPEVVTLTERAKRRLEDLGVAEDEAQGNVKIMSQKELVNHVDSLAHDLEEAWSRGEKVKSLRIVIQTTKMLINCKVPIIYPSMFVLVARVLDTFGRLVYDRIRRRAQFDERTGRPIQTLAVKFRSGDIPEEAKEMCKNWFFKVAAIRELIPRVYVEMCLWPCNKFLMEDVQCYSDMMGRFSAQIRGMGDPLAANYARFYLLHKAHSVFPDAVPLSHIMSCYEDFLFTKRQWELKSFEEYLRLHAMSMDEYVHLYSPSVRWQIAMIGQQADEKLFNNILDKFTAQTVRRSMPLNHIIASFKPQFISKNVMKFIAWIKDSYGGVSGRHECYISLGIQLGKQPPSEKMRLKILNEVWMDVSEVKDLKRYMPIAQVWLEFVSNHCKEREMGILLQDVREHLKQDSEVDVEVYISGILSCLLYNVKDFSVLFSMPDVLPLVDRLKPASKIELCKTVMGTFAQSGQPTGDAVLVNSLLEIAKTLHDSLTDFSIEDEKRQYALLISQFMKKVNYGKDFEAQLNFFVDCRRSFGKMEIVQEATVMGVLGVMDRACKVRAIKQHSKKAASFVKSCITFCHITIPVLADSFKRLRLLLLTAMVSLCMGFASQADTLLTTLFNTLLEVPSTITLPNNTIQSTEEQMVDLMQSLISSLLVVPGHPQEGPFYFLDGLMTLIKKYKWEPGSLGKPKLLIAILRVFCAMYQDEMPYHFAGGTIASNDELYAGNKEYKNEIEEMCTTLTDEVLTMLAEWDEAQDAASSRKMYSLAMDLLNSMIGFATPTDKMVSLATKVYDVATKNAPNDRDIYMVNTKKHIQRLDGWDVILAKA